MRVLVVNAGSTSLKLRLVDEDDQLVGVADLPSGHNDGLEAAVARLGPADAVGHRVVHGGTRTEAAVVDARLLDELTALRDLAPLHQPSALAAIEAMNRILPGAPAVACFDTAFHRSLPAHAATYALPRSWRERWGLGRAGFHGLSHAWASDRAAQLLTRPTQGLGLVTCHLGGGASVTAVDGGRSVDTTMGLTPLEGLVMATRSGTVDPGLLLRLQLTHGLTAEQVAEGLTHRSGLLGLAGTSDMREIISRSAQGDAAARLAFAVYVHRARAAVAAMAVALERLDALVFTGGVGEHQPVVRQAIADGLGLLGVRVDPERNREAVPDADISVSGAGVATLVVAAREDLVIAGEVRRVLDGSPSHGRSPGD